MRRSWAGKCNLAQFTDRVVDRWNVTRRRWVLPLVGPRGPEEVEYFVRQLPDAPAPEGWVAVPAVDEAEPLPTLTLYQLCRALKIPASDFDIMIG